MNDFCGSEFWDPALTWHTTDPDFTPCFLQTALAWTPCVFLFVAAPFDLHNSYTSKYSDIPWGPLNIFRILVNLVLIAFSVSDLVVSSLLEGDQQHYDVHYVTPAVRLLTFILVVVLALYQRRRGIVSSGYVFSFWLIIMLLSIPQFRYEIRQFEQRSPENNTIGTSHLSWADYQFISFMVFFPLLVIQLLAHCIADKRPRSSKFVRSEKGTKSSPEPYSGFLQTILYTWFDPMAWTGYRRSLEVHDIWDINPADASAELVPEFDEQWRLNVEKNEKSRSRSKKVDEKKAAKEKEFGKKTHGNIVPVLFAQFWPPFVFAGVMRLAWELLSFANPQILSLLIRFTANPEAPLWHGILFAASFFALAAVSSLLNGQFQYYCFLVGFRIRTVLISAIYRKALSISNTAKKNTTVGEIVNLMAVDAQRFFELILYLHIIWSGPLVIALCIYFLWEILGVAALTGVVVMILMLPLNGYVANKLKYFQLKQMLQKDERVKSMNEILGGMKVLKLYAWEASFEAAVNKIRAKELQIIRNAAVINAYVFFIWNMIPFLVTIASFATFVLVDPENNKITPNTVFVSLSLFNLLRMPMTMFPIMIQMVMQAWVSVVRINNFLNSENLDESVVTQNKDDVNALRIEGASFSWGNEEKVLKNINLRIPRGSIAAVVGPVGSGKSSLISSILGETEKFSGTVNTDGTMAYVAQQAWIQNATLRDNILFGRPFDNQFYETVIEACALKQDLLILPGGDQTEIGEKGINLSGGQKQRVALARAIYSRAKIYLFDDPLSAVDSHVGKHIFDKVLGPGGLLVNTTRLLVTHGISYLPHCDTIFVMNGGEITESGKYDVLLSRKGAFAEFIVQHLHTIEGDDEMINELKETLSETKIGGDLFQRAISTISMKNRRGSSTSVVSRRVSATQSVKAVDAPTSKDYGAQLIGKEEAAVGSVGLGIYIRYFRSIGWWYSSLCIVFGILYQGLQVYSNTWLSQWSERPDANAPDVRDLYLGVYGALGVGQALTLLGSSLCLAWGCLHAAGILHYNMMYQVMRLPMSFFDTTPLGRIMNRFSKDVDVVDNLLPNVIRTWILMFFTTIAILLVISITTPIFLAVIIPLALLYYFIQNFYVATSRQLKRIESITRSPIYSHFGESINGQSTIRAYNAQSRFILDSEQRVDFNQQCSYPSIIANRWLAIRLEIIGGFVIFFAALFAVLARETVSGSLVGLSITYALQITSVLSWLVRFTAEVETNIVANERMEEYSTERTEAPWVTQPVDPEWPTVGRVAFEEFAVRYREGLDLVLKSISVVIEGGERVGIVGRTGAGKSSLTLALFRIIESAGGRITIDNIDISTIGLHSLRNRLTIIPQDPVLFAGTLRMNIDPFESFTDEQIWTAIEHAHLKAFVSSTKNGLLHEVAEGGENLSIGQRQLVCLARALLRKTKVLILDEATAAVDLETDDLIQKTIREQFGDCTVLTIAHRLNTILDSDKVLVLDAGRVAEFASPQSLLNDTQSIFHAMAKDAGIVGTNSK